MSRVLIAYTTNSGSTEEIARTIGEEMAKDGDQVDVHRLEDVTSVEGYVAVVVGAPMIFGWHQAARAFVHKHEQALSRVPVAYFCTALSLTDTRTDSIDGIALHIDPDLAKPPKDPRRLGFKESYAQASSYLRPVLKAAPRVRPVSVAFFGGKLELFRLKLWQMLFVMVVIQAQPGDRRNWPFIEQWAHSWRAGAAAGPAQPALGGRGNAEAPRVLFLAPRRLDSAKGVPATTASLRCHSREQRRPQSGSNVHRRPRCRRLARQP
jgi:menaquinone-dependent protoporphyrinogen IX oxidase